MDLTYGLLRDAVAGAGVGFRCRTRLRPMGGAGDKVFPPTYATADAAPTRYATEERRDGDGRVTPAVVLDSVASQANRMEVALLDAVLDGRAHVPLTVVDFSDAPGLEGFGSISDLEAPHRIFDAILRDSLDGDLLFRLGPIGRSITEATSRSAAALFHHSPVTLVFGGWDSTGPKGGRGSKYERAVTSEVVALGVSYGVKTASRLDPLGIELKGSTLYRSTVPGESFTLEPALAVTEKGKPVEAKPSEVNHGNVAPSVEVRTGGITADEIVATTVLSLIQLRRLRFPVDAAGVAIADRPAAELAARTALAALGLAAATLAVDAGYDLRSRCVLVQDEPAAFRLIRRDGGEESIDLSVSDALALVDEAAAAAATAGLPWRDGPLRLRPTPRLIELTRRSRDAAAMAPAVGQA